jgi:hypothetical protein
VAFNLKQKINFEWPVKFKVPGSKKYDETEVVIKFKYLKQSEVDALAAMDYEQFCKEHVIGWSGVVDGEGKEIEFSAENLKEFLQFAGFGKEIFTTYLKVLSGIAEKN